MENASKALMMAAGVLIGILIISLAIYLITSFGSRSAELHKQVATEQLNQFNSQYTAYEGSDATIYDVVTVANLATENNITYNLGNSERTNDGTYYISVVLNGHNIEGNVDDANSGKLNDLKENYENSINTDVTNMNLTDNTINRTVDALPKYTCNVEINPKTNRVYKVYFTNKHK